LIGGLAILYYAKPIGRVHVGKSVPPSVEKHEIPLRQDASVQMEQMGAMDEMLAEAEKETT
jgi:hypothetical protein